MRRVVNSEQAAWLLQVDVKTLPKIMRANQVEPLGQVRVGRSTITRWDVNDVMAVGAGQG
jgi:hypothetical protein